MLFRSPFVMELPAYHIPAAKNVFASTWERGWSFIKRAGTIILLSAIVLWFLQAFGFENGTLGMIENNDHSLLASIGRFIAPIFAPLGFGKWQHAVATFTGLIAKENVVSTFGVLYGFSEVSESGVEFWSRFANDFTMISAFSFMIFNLLCAPCFAAMGASRREMNNGKWTWFAIGYLTVFAYVISFIFYQLALFIQGSGFNFLTLIAFLLTAVLGYLIFRKERVEKV